MVCLLEDITVISLLIYLIGTLKIAIEYVKWKFCPKFVIFE